MRLFLQVCRTFAHDLSLSAGERLGPIPAAGSAMDNMETQVSKMQKQLTLWGARLDELVARAAKGGEDAIEKERQLLAELRAKRDDLAAKLHETRESSSEKWQTIKSGVVSAYEELEAAFELVTKSRD